MKLEEYLCKKRWNIRVFSQHSGVSHVILYRFLNKDGGLSLDTALQIEVATEGEVSIWDLTKNASSIRDKTFRTCSEAFVLAKKPRRDKAANKKQEDDLQLKIPVIDKPIP